MLGWLSRRALCPASPATSSRGREAGPGLEAAGCWGPRPGSTPGSCASDWRPRPRPPSPAWRSWSRSTAAATRTARPRTARRRPARTAWRRRRAAWAWAGRRAGPGAGRLCTSPANSASPDSPPPAAGNCSGPGGEVDIIYLLHIYITFTTHPPLAKPRDRSGPPQPRPLVHARAGGVAAPRRPAHARGLAADKGDTVHSVQCEVVTSASNEGYPKVNNHGEGPY